MFKYFIVNIMHQYAPAFIVVCILLCLSFNYTFPLHRETKEWYSVGLSSNRNRSLKCDSNYGGTTDRTKKMTLNDPTELSETNVLQNYTALYANTKSTKKNKLSDADLRQYEQLVIMKKYPYLDLKELELKYHPSSGKNVRQNPKFAPEPELGAGEPGICESIEDGPNVEIHNRGLSGFAIPQPSKHGQAVIDAKKIADTRHTEDVVKLAKKSSRIFGSLRDDIKLFETKKSKMSAT